MTKYFTVTACDRGVGSRSPDRGGGRERGMPRRRQKKKKKLLSQSFDLQNNVKKEGHTPTGEVRDALA